MKKKYSLDYSIEKDTDRLAAVRDILDTLERDPSPTECEQMASYILYGKDDSGKNAVQRGELTDSNKRYNSFKKMEDKNKSLDEILDNPLSDQTNLRPATERYIYTKKKQAIARPKYDKKTGELIDIGDADIPGMQELWERIDFWEHVIAVNEGKVPPDEDTPILADSYRLYQLKHIVIDMRRHQYYLRDSYKPTIHFLNIQHPQPQTLDWDSDSFYWMREEEWRYRVTHALLHTISKNIEDYETKVDSEGQLWVKWIVRRHQFDWENPYHIRCLIDNYSNIYMELHEKLYSWGRTLIFDFDRYSEMAHLSPVREYILTRKIDKASYAQISTELQEKFGLAYNENHLCMIINKEIPERIANTVRRHRLLIETPIEERKECFTCKKLLPRDTLFFGINNSRKDHFSSNCKECERKKRIARGTQAENDRRTKDTKMLEMSPRQT